MPTEEAKGLLENLAKIQLAGQEYFGQVENLLVGKDFEFAATNYYAKLPKAVRKAGDSIIDQIIELAPQASEAVRRSPMLSDSDIKEVGHSVKGMRAALRLANYRHWGPEVLHDEGQVLGVSPGGQSEDLSMLPQEAAKHFNDCTNRLRSILELVGATVQDSRVAIVGSGLSAPAGYRPGTAFIMMSMQSEKPELTDVADTVKRCFAKFGIEAVRADDIEHEDIITKKILDEIRTAKFLFADLSGERQSVYYEVGYAHALGRRVTLFRQDRTVIHFDLAAYNCAEYKNLRELEELLTRRLEYATGQRPK
jgi:hypothetical protein